MRSEDAIYFGEFIGREISVSSSANLTLKGKRGMVVDETKKTLVINDGKKQLVIPKDICSFEIRSGERSLEILGKAIVSRPEDRIKEHRKIERMIRKGGN